MQKPHLKLIKFFFVKITKRLELDSNLSLQRTKTQLEFSNQRTTRELFLCALTFKRHNERRARGTEL